MTYKEQQIQNRINESLKKRSDHLDLSMLELEYIPSNILELRHLKSLDIRDNKIRDISIIGKLLHINNLNLRGNKIEDFSILSEIRGLEMLDLGNNNIENISFLSELDNLYSLDLRNNNITDIHPLRDLSNIHNLNISNNKISDILPVLPLLVRGRRIHFTWQTTGIIVENNPLNIPIEIIDKTSANNQNPILNYLLELQRQGEERINEVKLLLIGKGGAGKTTLARRLAYGEKSVMPQESETTKGIDIYRYNFTIQDGQDFRIRIWDFGGQEIYHATHQFFLTKRSLYILVDDTREDQKTVDDYGFNYWLQVVDLLSEKSPLLIVQNEKGDRSKQIDLSSMKGRYENVKERYQTNLATCRGLESVKKAIEFYAQQLPHVGEVLPKQWALIRHYLEERSLTEDYIDLKEYFRICSIYKIPEKNRALHLSSYLHDLGIFLHFNQDIDLKNTFILNNTWATDAVYKVLDNEDVKSRFGIFSNNDLDIIWSDERYAYKHSELIALMKKFELCYELPTSLTNGQRWLSPQLLRVERPNFDWNYENNLSIIFKYNFMPKGLLTRFIVRMNRYVYDTNLVWRSGIIAERNDTKAWVNEIYGEKEIVIRVEGKQPKEFITLIVSDFDEMHATFPGLNMQKMIPCNCAMCLSKSTPFYYEYDKLIERKHRKKTTIECGMSYDAVNVQSLIDGVFVSEIKIDKEYVLKLVENDKLRDAIEELYPYILDNAILLKRRFNVTNKQELLGLQTHQYSEVEKQRIAASIIEILGDI
jgi:internalin A